MNASVVRARHFYLPNRKVYRKRRQKFKKKLKPCYICADWGHNGNFCPQTCESSLSKVLFKPESMSATLIQTDKEALSTPFPFCLHDQVNKCSVCSEEESKNNVEEDNTSLFCLKCGGTGHVMFSCTNDYDPADLKGVQCYICMDFGHLCCTENSTEGPTQASCYNCGQSGHHGFECTKMNAVANKFQPVSIGLKCQKGIHSPETWDLYNKSTSAKTITLGKDEVLDKSMTENSRKTQTWELDNKLIATENATLEKSAVPNKPTKRKRRKARTRDLDNKSNSSKNYTMGKDFVLNNSVKENSPRAQIAELSDNKSTTAETTLLGKDAVPNEFVKKISPKTRAEEIANKPTSAETSTVTKDAVPDKTIEGKSRETRRKERRRKRKQEMATSYEVQNLPTMSMTGNTIPRHGQYYEIPGSNAWSSPPAAAARNCLVNSPALNQSTYGRPGLNVWLPPPAAAARNCLVNSPALNQSTYGRPGLNVWLLPPAAAARNCHVYSSAINQSSYGRPGLNAWLPPPAAAARNYLEISPAVNQSSYQTAFHFYHYNTNYREATHVPPNPFPPSSLRPHEIFHQGTQLPGTPQNRIQLPNQNFTHQIRTHVPQSTFDSSIEISQQPELPHHVSNIQISALLPHQKLQHQLPSHRTWMNPPGWKPYS